MSNVKYEIEGSVESQLPIARARQRIDDNNDLLVEFQAPNGSWYCVVRFGKDGRLHRDRGAQHIPGLAAQTNGRIECQ